MDSPTAGGNMKFTTEFIQQQREIAAKSYSQPGEFAGAVNDGSIAGCSGYHPETDEYEFYQIAQCGTKETAEYLSAAGQYYPDALDEIERLRQALEEIRAIGWYSPVSPEYKAAWEKVDTLLKGGEK